MALFEGKTPAERNKIIAALVFGVVAVFLVGRMLFGSSGPSATTSNVNKVRPTPRPNVVRGAADAQGEEIEVPLQPVVVETASYAGGEPGRNIFAFFARTDATATSGGTLVEPPTPTPTPVPPPPLNVSSIAPQSVYAQTGDFRLQISGDKFTPAVRVYVGETEVPTQFGGAQQLTATVPAALISAAGTRTVAVRTPDSALYSNTATLNVMPPPTPNYTYIGYIGRQRYQNETAVLRDQKNEIVSVKIGDIVGGRFRVTGIRAQAVEVTDTQLNIKHTLNYVETKQAGGPVPPRSIPPQPPPRSDDEPDTEPEL